MVSKYIVGKRVLVVNENFSKGKGKKGNYEDLSKTNFKETRDSRKKMFIGKII